jgi:hypothetical protein
MDRRAWRLLEPSGCWLPTELSKSKLLYDWRFTANQFVLASRSLRPMPTAYFFNWTLAVISLCNILSDEKIGLSLMNMLGFLSNVRIAHIACYWKFFLLHYIQVLCQSWLCKVAHACLTYLMPQRQLRHLNGRKLTTAKFKPQLNWVWVWVLYYDRRSVGQSVLE